MSVNTCPAAVVEAPVESVWEILSDTTLYEAWWETRAEHIMPTGKAVPGQMIYLETSGLGRKWVMTLRIEMVNPEKHQILFNGELLGSISHNAITCTAINATSCQVQYC